MRRIDIGCGLRPREGYESVDIRPLSGVQHVCSASNLPFDTESIDAIYSRHLIEHLTLKEFLVTLREWSRVLKQDGELYIICPNVLWHFAQVVQGTHASFYKKESGENDRYWGFGSIYGWQQDEYDVHKFGYYFDLLKDILLEFGFTDIIDLTDAPEGLEHAPHHLEVRATRSTTAPEPEHSRFWNHLESTH